MIIGISGKAQSGKDTVGSMLAYFIATNGDFDFERYVEFNVDDYWYKHANFLQHKYFAYALKECVANLLHTTVDNLNLESYKRSTINWLDNMSVRELLQKFGTGIRNSVDENFWVKCLLTDYTEKQAWIITDVRFTSEIQALQDRNAILIRVNNTRINSGNHVSETELDNCNEFNYYINNEGTLKDLFMEVYTVYKSLKSLGRVGE